MPRNQHDALIETRLRVLTWNIWWQFGPWQERAPAILSALAASEADIIALQEVWSKDDENFAAQLAGDLGFHHFHASVMPQSGLRMGNAILSRWPIARNQSIRLPGIEGTDENRAALFAQIDGPRGPIPMFTTHLNWKPQHSHIRQQQVAALTRFVQQHHDTGFPPIVCGDFNAEPGSDEIRMMTGQTICPVDDLVFHDAWRVAGDGGPGYTWDNTNPHVAAELDPDRRIDYIFTGWPGKRGAGHVVDCRIACNRPVNGVWASDHHALQAELRY